MTDRDNSEHQDQDFGEDEDEALHTDELEEEEAGDEEIDNVVPSHRLRDRGKGQVTENGVFEEEPLLKRVPEAPKKKKDLRKADVDRSCFGYCFQGLFGNIRWSQSAHFPVMKYNLSEEDLDCDRGEIIVRFLYSNRGVVLRGIDSGVRNMSVGETSIIKIRYDKAYSSFCMGNSIPPRSNIVLNADLLAINGRGEAYKYKLARQMRRCGRVFLRVKNYIVDKLERAYYIIYRKVMGIRVITEPPDDWVYNQEAEESDGESEVIIYQLYYNHLTHVENIYFVS